MKASKYLTTTTTTNDGDFHCYPIGKPSSSTGVKWKIARRCSCKRSHKTWEYSENTSSQVTRYLFLRNLKIGGTTKKKRTKKSIQILVRWRHTTSTEPSNLTHPWHTIIHYFKWRTQWTQRQHWRFWFTQFSAKQRWLLRWRRGKHWQWSRWRYEKCHEKIPFCNG